VPGAAVVGVEPLDVGVATVVLVGAVVGVVVDELGVPVAG
jgi:hypothetical protein